MKQILLKLDDEIYNAWKQELLVKHMCGNFDPQAAPDAVGALIVKAIDEGKSEVTITPRKKKVAK